MQVTISIKQDNGSVVEIVKELKDLKGEDIIAVVEQQVMSIKEEVLPLLCEQLVEHHQSEFKGKKNQEKERE